MNSLLLDLILEAFDGGAWKEALALWRSEIDNDDRVEMWAFFSSEQRAFLNDRRDRKYLQEFWDETDRG